MKVYVTFGQAHIHRVNDKILDRDSVAVIEAPTHAKGREIAFELFGDKFFTTYPEDAWRTADIQYYPRGFIGVN